LLTHQKNKVFRAGPFVARQGVTMSDEHAAKKFVIKAIGKAIDSEQLAVAHYRRLSEIVPTPGCAKRFLSAAAEEARHATALRRAAARDGVRVGAGESWDRDLDGVHAAFESCARGRDAAACIFIQDVFLEVIAIELYDVLRRAASSTGTLAIASLVEKAILPDERLHLVEGLREIARVAPRQSERTAAFQRAAAAVFPAMHAFTDLPVNVPCARTCSSCQDRCLKLDACAGDIPLAGGWDRVLAAIEQAARRVGIDAPFERAS
jgi:hypothetical protein